MRAGIAARRPDERAAFARKIGADYSGRASNCNAGKNAESLRLAGSLAKGSAANRCKNDQIPFPIEEKGDENGR